jgi:hypothetical protein
VQAEQFGGFPGTAPPSASLGSYAHAEARIARAGNPERRTIKLMKRFDGWFKAHPRWFGLVIGGFIAVETTFGTWLVLRIEMPDRWVNPYPLLLSGITVGLVIGSVTYFASVANLRRNTHPD